MTAKRLFEKQKKLAHLAELPFCVGRVTLLAGPTFLAEPG